MNRIDYGSLSESDSAIYKSQKQRIQLVFDELCNFVNYPPFRIFSNGLANPYIDELRESHDNESTRKLDDYLDEQFKPFKEFIEKYDTNISIAKKYLSRSNRDPKLAMEMYAIDNPEHKLTDEELYAPSRTM
jgi:hypothetical protein